MWTQERVGFGNPETAQTREIGFPTLAVSVEGGELGRKWASLVEGPSLTSTIPLLLCGVFFTWGFLASQLKNKTKEQLSRFKIMIILKIITESISIK